MEKINIAELLKDCPSGMELDCTMYENVYFNKIYDEDCIYQIGCYTINDGVRNSINFTKYGKFNTTKLAKCVIFPKGKTTWEGFIPPCKFKVGDKITDKNKFIYRITEVTDKGYKLHDLKTTFITFEEADSYFVKVVDIFDISTLKPFDEVLVRQDENEKWGINFFGAYNYDEGYYYTTGNWMYKQCIPYEGNEYLLGTTANCDNFYKTW